MDYTMTPEDIKKMEHILAMNELDFDEFIDVVQEACDKAEPDYTLLILSRQVFLQRRRERIPEAGSEGHRSY
jgi:hypothetical protein